MTKRRAISIFASVAITALCLAASAIAQTNVTLTGPPPGYVYDGIYMSPYYATVGTATNVPVVCDDFADESYPGSSWTATMTSFSNINSSNTAWGQAGGNLSLYNAAAWLTTQVLAQVGGSNGQIIDSFALWAVFDPTGVESYLASNSVNSGSLTTAQLCNDIFGGTSGCKSSAAGKGGLLYTAEFGNVYTPGEFSNFTVISPSNNGVVCTAGSCPAQEFLTDYQLPEGGTALSYLFIAGLCCFGAIYFRSRKQTAQVAA
jgi:hypothetical protein